MKFAFIDYQDKSQCSECIYREPRAEPVSPFDKVSEIDPVEKVWEKIEVEPMNVVIANTKES